MQKYGPRDVDTLFADATAILVAKGQKVVHFEPKQDTFDQKAMQAAVIGPSGNLRAPTLRVGKTWLVGFHGETYAERIPD